MQKGLHRHRASSLRIRSFAVLRHMRVGHPPVASQELVTSPSNVRAVGLYSKNRDNIPNLARVVQREVQLGRSAPEWV